MNGHTQKRDDKDWFSLTDWWVGRKALEWSFKEFLHWCFFFILFFLYYERRGKKLIPDMNRQLTTGHGVMGHYVSFFKIESRKVRTTLYRFGFCMFLNEIGI